MREKKAETQRGPKKWAQRIPIDGGCQIGRGGETVIAKDEGGVRKFLSIIPMRRG